MQSKNCMSLHPALTHKTHAAHVLQLELENYKNMRDRYSRLIDHKNALQYKIQNQQQINEQTKKHSQDVLFSQNQRVDDLRKDFQQFEKDLKKKNQKLKESSKLQQELQSYYDQCGAQIREQALFHEQTKNMDELIQAEKERILEQQSCLKEEIKKSQHTQINIRESIDKIKEKVYSFKNYIRELLKQEKKIQDQLTILEEQNNSIDSVNVQLHYDCEKINRVVKQVKDEVEDRKILLKAKELEEGRIRKEINEKNKLKRMENDKFRNLQQQIQQKAKQCQKVTALNKEAVSMIEKQRNENEQIEGINLQLQHDLVVCQKHLENVAKNNNVFKYNLVNYNEMNKVVIEKLEQVGNQEKIYSPKDYLEATSDGFGLSAL